MAYILSVQPSSPFKRSFSDTPYIRSLSSLTESTKDQIPQPTISRNPSVTSIVSLPSFLPQTWTETNDEYISSVSAQSIISLLSDIENDKDICFKQAPHAVSSEMKIFRLTPSNLQTKKQLVEQQVETVQNNFKSELDLFHRPIIRPNNPLRLGNGGDVKDISRYDLHKVSCDLNHGSTSRSTSVAQITKDPVVFKRWMCTLRRRNYEQDVTGSRAKAWRFNIPRVHRHKIIANNGTFQHQKSSSLSSSLAFVTAVKSATITLASGSAAPVSWSGNKISSFCRGERSSGFSDARISVDSTVPTSYQTSIDRGTWLRSIQRRKILEELISTEETYIRDMKALVEMYSTFLTSVRSTTSQTWGSIHQNMMSILHIHEDLLGELHQAIPYSECSGDDACQYFAFLKARHTRHHSADIVSGPKMRPRRARALRHSFDIDRSPEEYPAGLVADAKTAGVVGRIFNRLLTNFLAYEEYFTFYDSIVQEMEATQKIMPTWQVYEKGIESLSNSLTSLNNRMTSGRRALSFQDLLVKPMQRITKYPILFEDLCKRTPVYDDPESHAELEKALFRLRGAAREIDRAKGDSERKRKIETSWILQNRLIFKDQLLSRSILFRCLGHVLLCGVLHIAYESTSRAKGQYMICILYHSYLVVAKPEKSISSYQVFGVISLARTVIEQCNNGKGLQCHNALFTWKILFHSGGDIYELILSACSPREEQVWVDYLRDRIKVESLDLADDKTRTRELLSYLSFDVRPVSSAFFQREILMEDMALRTRLHHIIIKNTHSERISEEEHTPASITVTRSQSQPSPNQISILAPRKIERTRLESILEDIWTKDLLPYPGMIPRRVENPIKASANSVMRKLSMVSIASNFSKRSASHPVQNYAQSGETPKFSRSELGKNGKTKKQASPKLVDFHSAPAAFLPVDFELHERPNGHRGKTLNKPNLNFQSANNARMPHHFFPKHGAIQTDSNRQYPEDEKLHGVATSPSTNSSKHHQIQENLPTTQQDSHACVPKRVLKQKSRIFRFWS